jgi:hypothetical protein
MHAAIPHAAAPHACSHPACGHPMQPPRMRPPRMQPPSTQPPCKQPPSTQPPSTQPRLHTATLHTATLHAATLHAAPVESTPLHQAAAQHRPCSTSGHLPMASQPSRHQGTSQAHWCTAALLRALLRALPMYSAAGLWTMPVPCWCVPASAGLPWRGQGAGHRHCFITGSWVVLLLWLQLLLDAPCH